MNRGGLSIVPWVLLILGPATLAAQDIPTPVSHFGFELGSDRKLADWEELTSYYERIAIASPRVSLDTLGLSTKGRPFVMLTITSEGNQARIDELKEIQSRLADPRTIAGDDERDRLLEEGKAIVLITHSIHATEVGGAQMAPRLIYKMASSNDPEVSEILENVIFLDIPSLNPDGLDWVVEWYRRFLGTQYEGGPLPWLYQYYVGHDNNRDWYAFTQVETMLTVLGAHNVWHPQIVHDIHQMGSNGARIFFPPYIDPFEQNVDPGLIAGGSQLGAFMAASLTASGMPGAIINDRYDGFTPARAYMHYHGGVRILSETASAEVATPVTVTPEDLRSGRGFDATVSTWNFPWPWEGGEWGLPDIVNYMEAGATALLQNAARNRRYWLENFYNVNRRAVEGWDRWPEAWVIPPEQVNAAGLAYVLRILTMGDVEVRRAEQAFGANGRRFSAGSYVVVMHQPYAAFAETMLEIQHYPDLREYPGGPPIRPYDVTAHTLGLLMGVDYFPVEGPLDVPLSDPIGIPDWQFQPPASLTGPNAPRIGIYRSWQEPATEGWTRWVFDQHGLAFDTLRDARLRQGNLREDYDVILFQSQSASSIRNGYRAGTLPPDYTGGVGEDGTQALRSFVRNGGRIVAIEEATDFVIDIFGLGVTNAVDRLPAEEFFVPGSILKVDLEQEQSLNEGLGATTPVWFWTSSRAFDVDDPGVRVAARYAEGDPLLSGWLLGPEYLAGRPALLETQVGEGSVTLFGFQPDYRGQTVATWPLLFNALGGSVPPEERSDAGRR